MSGSHNLAYIRASDTYRSLLSDCVAGKPLAGCKLEWSHGSRDCFKIRLFEDAYLSVLCHPDERWGEILTQGFTLPAQVNTALLAQENFPINFGVPFFLTKEELINEVHQIASALLNFRPLPVTN